jgi:hypothetical protein
MPCLRNSTADNVDRQLAPPHATVFKWEIRNTAPRGSFARHSPGRGIDGIDSFACLPVA